MQSLMVEVGSLFIIMKKITGDMHPEVSMTMKSCEHKLFQNTEHLYSEESKTPEGM